VQKAPKLVLDDEEDDPHDLLLPLPHEMTQSDDESVDDERDSEKPVDQQLPKRAAPRSRRRGSERDDMSLSATSSPVVSHLDESSQHPSPITLPHIDDDHGDKSELTLLAFNDILQAAAGVEDAEEKKQEEASPVPVGGGGKKAVTKPKAAVSSLSPRLSLCLPSHPFHS
jgi:hypothetical protein